jgi:hypothetical protein
MARIQPIYAAEIQGSSIPKTTCTPPIVTKNIIITHYL